MKFVVELYSENDFDREIILKLLNKKLVGVGQQKIDVDDKGENNDGVGGEVVLATDKQRALMKKHKIPFDDGTTIKDATRLISDYFESKKKGD